MTRFERAFAKQDAKTSTFDWLTYYQRAAERTFGVTAQDQRYPAILSALDAMDEAFASNHVDAFLAASDRIATLMDEKEVPCVQTALTL